MCDGNCNTSEVKVHTNEELYEWNNKLIAEIAEKNNEIQFLQAENTRLKEQLPDENELAIEDVLRLNIDSLQNDVKELKKQLKDKNHCKKCKLVSKKYVKTLESECEKLLDESSTFRIENTRLKDENQLFKDRIALNDKHSNALIKQADEIIAIGYKKEDQIKELLHKQDALITENIRLGLIIEQLTKELAEKPNPCACDEVCICGKE